MVISFIIILAIAAVISGLVMFYNWAYMKGYRDATTSARRIIEHIMGDICL